MKVEPQPPHGETIGGCGLGFPSVFAYTDVPPEAGGLFRPGSVKNTLGSNIDTLPRRGMAKAKSDIILRDRLQMTLGASGDLGLVYGRIDLSDYVNVVEKKGLLVKDVYLQIRDPNNGGAGAANTGVWSVLVGDADPGSAADVNNHWKAFVSTRAYENAADVGIASPDVLHIEEWTLSRYGAATVPTTVEGHVHNTYPTRDYHPGGYPVVSDLLVGFAVDCASTEDQWDNATLEIDIMLVAETTSITAKQMTQLLTQAQDL